MKLEEVHEEISAALEQLKHCFTPDCELTFFMRLPGNDECYILVTNDDPKEIVRVLQEKELGQK